MVKYSNKLYYTESSTILTPNFQTLTILTGLVGFEPTLTGVKALLLNHLDIDLSYTIVLYAV